MSDALTNAGAFSRARAFKLHEHFVTLDRVLALPGWKLCVELGRIERMINGTILTYPGGERVLEASVKTLDREWRNWLRGGREGEEEDRWIKKPEALLLAYKSGCGGHKAMPRKTRAELQRRMTLVTGGRGKDRMAKIKWAHESLARDFAARRPIPGINYEEWPVGAEWPWHYRTSCRHKPSKGLRLLGNVGASAHKGVSAQVSLNYSTLRKCELFTLDDVRLDIVCTHEATGEMVGAVCYILMEVASRMIVAYVIKPCAPDATSAVRHKSITEEDVAELLAHGLQAPGFGLGDGYVTHILFERGTTACSEACKDALQGWTDHGIKVHRTGMVGGVRWMGSARDQKVGNSAGKAVIEAFNRQLHKLLLHLPGQRGNCAENQPQNMGELGKSRYRFDGNADAGNRRRNGGTLIDEDEYLAQLNLATGGTMQLRLNTLYFRELEVHVQEAIKLHNTEPGHGYRGHGNFEQQEVQPGVWRDREGRTSNTQHPTPNIQSAESPKREYTLRIDGFSMGAKEKAIYWKAWNRVAAVKPDLDRHALTRRAIKDNPRVEDLTRGQFVKLLQVFAAIVRDAQRPKTDIPF